jgi:membrane dipeptidase
LPPLYQRGYKAADLQKILGGNLMRVFGEVEKTAKIIQAEEAANPDKRHEVAPDAQPKQ